MAHFTLLDILKQQSLANLLLKVCFSWLLIPFIWQLFLLGTRQAAASQSRIIFLLLIFAAFFIFSQLFLHLLPTKNTPQLIRKFYGLSILLSPIWAAPFYRIYLNNFPLPALWLDLIFRERWKIIPLVTLLYIVMTVFILYRFFTLRIIVQLTVVNSLFLLIINGSFQLFQHCLTWFPALSNRALLSMFCFQLFKNALFATQLIVNRWLIVRFVPIHFAFAAPATPYLLLGLLASVGYFALLNQQMNHVLNLQPVNTLTISHRGVSQKNGVQNTTAALTKTSQHFRPDLIEMDVQETADHQLVVIHDLNLKRLAHVNARVDELTWKQLKRLTLKENGQTAHLSLFSTYLKQADALQQPLLIELKVSNKTRSSIARLFCQQYSEKQLASASHQLQSMDLQTTEYLKRYYPHIKVGYILPFDLLGAPKTKADFLNLERRTFTKDLAYSLQGKKQIYLWSVNSPQQTSYLRLLPVKGLLTDDLTALKKQLLTKKDRIIFYFYQ